MKCFFFVLIFVVLAAPSKSDLSGAVSAALASNHASPADVSAWFLEPITVGSNVVQVARPSALLQAEFALNFLATNYVSQAVLDATPIEQKSTVISQAINQAVSASTGDAKTAHVANGANLLSLAQKTRDLGGGFESPWYRSPFTLQTNLITSTRWEVLNPGDPFPSTSEIRSALRSALRSASPPF